MIISTSASSFFFLVEFNKFQMHDIESSSHPFQYLNNIPIRLYITIIQMFSQVSVLLLLALYDLLYCLKIALFCCDEPKLLKSSL